MTVVQSSCTKPDMEADIPSSMEQPTEQTDSVLGTQPTEPKGDTTKADTSGEEKNMAIDVRWEQTNVVSGNMSREVIDLIGSFDSYPKPSYKSSLNYGSNKIDHPSPLLDLSLRRSHPTRSVNQFSDDRHRLKQSDVSAFSLYINRTQPPLTSGSVSISNQQKDCEINYDKPLSMNPVEYISDTHSAPVGSSQHNMISQHGQGESQTESQFPSQKERVFPVPVPVRGLQFENPCATYGSVLPPPFFFEGNNTTESHEDLGHMSSATDHSGNSSFCNGGSLSRLNSIGSGSNGHVNLGIDGNNNIHRSIQREAALNKFRMKRKDRCFDKKVHNHNPILAKMTNIRRWKQISH